MRFMLIRIAEAVVTTILMAALFLFAQEHKERAHNPDDEPAKSPVPLILQDEDGDHLVHRAGPLGGLPFTIKVDKQFGNSEDFFVFAETLAPGQAIPFHKASQCGGDSSV